MTQLTGQRIFVYWDSQRKCFSLRSLRTGRILNYQTDGTKKTKIAIHKLLLSDCLFQVNEERRQRVLRKQAKNVHAGIQATVNSWENVSATREIWQEVVYNPFLYDSFVIRESKQPVHQANWVMLLDGPEARAKVYAQGITHHAGESASVGRLAFCAS